MSWEEVFGISLTDAEAASLNTPREAIDLISAKLGASNEWRPCLSQRAFHLWRRRLVEVAGVERRRIRPGAVLKDLLGPEAARRWREFGRATGLGKLGSLGGSRPSKVSNLVEADVTYSPSRLRSPGQPWSRSEVREVVRAVIRDITGCPEFRDDADFVTDIGIG